MDYVRGRLKKWDTTVLQEKSNILSTRVVSVDTEKSGRFKIFWRQAGLGQMWIHTV